MHEPVRPLGEAIGQVRVEPRIVVQDPLGPPAQYGQAFGDGSRRLQEVRPIGRPPSRVLAHPAHPRMRWSRHLPVA